MEIQSKNTALVTEYLVLSDSARTISVALPSDGLLLAPPVRKLRLSFCFTSLLEHPQFIPEPANLFKNHIPSAARALAAERVEKVFCTSTRLKKIVLCPITRA